MSKAAERKKITLGKVLAQTQNPKITATVDSVLEKLKVCVIQCHSRFLIPNTDTFIAIFHEADEQVR